MSKNRVGGRAVIEFIVGGASQVYAPASRADVVVFVDALAETRRVPDLPHVIKVPLGDCDTVISLLERLQGHYSEAEELLEKYRKLPNVYLSAGMAQDPLLGACGIKDLALRGELEKIFGQIHIRVLEATNGELSHIVVRELNSNAGGMGSGGAPEIGALFLNYLEQRTDAMFCHHMIRIGGLTYAAIGNRVIENVIKTTGSNIDSLLGHSHARRTRDLEFIELPMEDKRGLTIRDNGRLRDSLTGPCLAARLAESVDRDLDAWEINHKTESRFGEMRRVKVGWSESLDQELLLRAAATLYRDRIKELLTNPAPPDMSLAAKVEVEVMGMESPFLPLGEVSKTLREKGGVESLLLDRYLETKLQTFRGANICFWTTQNRKEVLDQVLDRYERPRDSKEAVDQVGHFRGVIAHLERAAQGAKEDHEKVRKAYDKRRRELSRRVRRIGSIRHRLDLVLYSHKRVGERAQAALEAFYEAHRRLSEASARVESLSAGLEKVRNRLADYQERWLARPMRKLDEALGGCTAYLGTVKFAPLAEVYGELLNATLRAGQGATVEEKSLKPMLLRSAVGITLEGIGRMMGTDATPESIIAAFEEERFRWKSPLWGGAISYEEPRHRFIVLPPMVAADLAELKRAAGERGFGAALATAETLAAGCCVVSLAFFPVARLEDARPPLYAGTEQSWRRNDKDGFHKQAAHAVA